MLSPPPTVRIYLCLKSIDMRRWSLKEGASHDMNNGVPQIAASAPSLLASL